VGIDSTMKDIVPIEEEEETITDPKILLYELEKQEAYEDSVEKYRKIAQAGIAQWIKDFKDQKIKFDSVDDLEKLIRIDLNLQKGKY